ncbi:HD-GYP domain-containing protein [Lacrimispora defluvii]|uniref:HD domain-containing protein n=1 Tax=Lacrimispora defluvii TaxID=2719233 RepID=A0ABX1VPV3_9FIRM|nr:HD domain-containing phosphohydrolase [Lacrimispora defluvii]NNJ29839.1 HD domain-containing protein [Lacrimispora defluvii]
MQVQYTKDINNESILNIIRRFCNYIDPRLTEHGSHVSYIVFQMLRETGRFTKEELRNICFVAQLHDVGAYKTEEISRMLQFETKDVWDHSFYGYLFIRYFSPLKDFAPAVLLHHLNWDFLEKQCSLNSLMKDLGQLIHIADRIDVLMSLQNCSWEETLSLLKKDQGTVYAPHIIELAEKLDFKNSIEEEWKADSQFNQFLTGIPLSGEAITDYLKMLVFIIDFRSHHTVTHTITTTSISYELGKLLSYPQDRLNVILCGALLHDLGKIAIPVEILEYPGKLSRQAMNIMRTHVDYTKEIFGGCIDEAVERIALRHHEKLNGTGYPKGLSAKDLSKEERLVAIADIISALTGTRSYKDTYPMEKIKTILEEMKNDELVDPDIVNIALKHLYCILETTAVRCRPILHIYEKLNKEYQNLLILNGDEEKLRFALSIKQPEKAELWP